MYLGRAQFDITCQSWSWVEFQETGGNLDLPLGTQALLAWAAAEAAGGLCAHATSRCLQHSRAAQMRADDGSGHSKWGEASVAKRTAVL